MKAQIETYQRECEIHKEVEKELAKRSHFCQKVIKRLKQDLSDFQSGVKPEEGASNAAGKKDVLPVYDVDSTKNLQLADMKRSYLVLLPPFEKKSYTLLNYFHLVYKAAL